MSNIAIDYVLLGKNIQKCRLDKQLSYKELFQLSHISIKTLRNIESGNSYISLTNLIIISNALNVSMDYLLMDSLKNKSCAIHFMLDHAFEGLTIEEADVLTETGYMIKRQLIKFESANSCLK